MRTQWSVFFQSLEVVNATFVGEGQKISTPRLSKVTKMGVKHIIGKGARVGLGLGKYIQERSKAMPMIEARPLWARV